MVIIWAVNSSSKYLVSVSDVTWGLKGGLSCREWGGRLPSWLCTARWHTNRPSPREVGPLEPPHVLWCHAGTRERGCHLHT